MARKKRMDERRASRLGIRHFEMYCDDCGTVYDLRSGEGLCEPCGAAMEEPGDEAPGSTEDVPQEEPQSLDAPDKVP